MMDMSETFAEEQPAIISFDDLLAMARAEPHPCRLLTVLVKADAVFRRRVGGEEVAMDEGVLQPLMARDWAVTATLNLETVVATADEINNEWTFLMTAIMPGSRGQSPTSDECDPHLERMARALTIGADLSAFVFFDREGRPVAVTGSAASAHC